MNAFCTNSEPNQSSAPRLLVDRAATTKLLPTVTRLVTFVVTQFLMSVVPTSTIAVLLHSSLAHCEHKSRLPGQSHSQRHTPETRSLPASGRHPGKKHTTDPKNTLRTRKDTQKHTKTHYFFKERGGCPALSLVSVPLCLNDPTIAPPTNTKHTISTQYTHNNFSPRQLLISI